MIRAGSPAAESPARLRLDHVDGIRAVAALVVYFNHAYAQTWNPYHDRYASGFLSPARYSLVAGHLAVTVFIVVSGFCLMLPVLQHGGQLRGGVKEFFKRRARRILPPYYAAVALCLALIYTVLREPTGSLWDVPLQVVVKPSSILVHLALLQDFFATGHINYVFWSIAVEWHIYFLMPLLVIGWRRLGAVPMVVLSLVVGYALMLGLIDTRVGRANPHYIGMFTLGMAAAYVARSDRPGVVRARDAFPWGILAGLALLVTCGLTYGWGVKPSVARFHLLDLPVGIMATALLIASSKPAPGRLTRLFGFRPLVFVGTFSYSLYLVHAPALQLLWLYVFVPLGIDGDALFYGLMTAGLAATLGASYLFHLAFEAPFMGASHAARTARPAPLPAP